MADIAERNNDIYVELGTLLAEADKLEAILKSNKLATSQYAKDEDLGSLVRQFGISAETHSSEAGAAALALIAKSIGELRCLDEERAKAVEVPEDGHQSEHEDSDVEMALTSEIIQKAMLQAWQKRVCDTSQEGQPDMDAFIADFKKRRTEEAGTEQSSPSSTRRQPRPRAEARQRSRSDRGDRAEEPQITGANVRRNPDLDVPMLQLIRPKIEQGSG